MGGECQSGFHMDGRVQSWSAAFQSHIHQLQWTVYSDTSQSETSVNLFRNQSSIIGEGAFTLLHTIAGQNKFALSLWHPVVFWAVPQRGGHVPVMWLCSHDTCMWPIISQPWWHIYHTPFFFFQRFHRMQLTCIWPCWVLQLEPIVFGG